MKKFEKEVKVKPLSESIMSNLTNCHYCGEHGTTGSAKWYVYVRTSKKNSFDVRCCDKHLEQASK